MKQSRWIMKSAALSAAVLLSFRAASAEPPVKHGAVTDHVIIISIDGLRPDAIAQFGMETLTRLMNSGAYSLQAQTIMPSTTLPAHTSMLTGVSPKVHGVTWNDDRSSKLGTIKTPTIFGFAKENGFSTAAFFSKSKFHHLQKPGTLDYTQAPPTDEPVMATQTVPDAIRYMERSRPNLLFVHIGEPDYAGHAAGWMSTVYGWASKRADGAVGSLLEAADRVYGANSYTVIVSSDHGGHGKNHGTRDERDMTIPWIASGEGVRHSGDLGEVNTMDTAATVLWLLGVPEPANWQGKPVVAAFTDAARTAAEAATTTAAAGH